MKKAPTHRARCLDLASRAVAGRGDAYGAPEDLFELIAARWSLTLGIEISARQVVLCMIDMKIERAVIGRQADSPVDIAGYAACLYELDRADERLSACHRQRGRKTERKRRAR